MYPIESHTEIKKGYDAKCWLRCEERGILLVYQEENKRDSVISEGNMVTLIT